MDTENFFFFYHNAKTCGHPLKLNARRTDKRNYFFILFTCVLGFENFNGRIRNIYTCSTELLKVQECCHLFHPQPLLSLGRVSLQKGEGLAARNVIRKQWVLLWGKSLQQSESWGAWVCGFWENTLKACGHKSYPSLSYETEADVIWFQNTEQVTMTDEYSAREI